MKLRIQGDALRLRLTRPEVDQLAATGRVEDATHVALGRRLVYAVCAADGPDLTAHWDGDRLTVGVPRAAVAAWPGDDRVGFEGAQDAGDGRRLALLVEKDFQCLHREADEPDQYPNPAAEAPSA